MCSLFRRYFSVEEVSTEHGDNPPSGSQFTQDAARKLLESANLTSAVEERVGSPLVSEPSQDVLASAQRLIAEKQFAVASTMLEKAVEAHKDSEDIWLLYLQLKSQMASPAELPGLYKLFHTAVTACQSYAVIWEVSVETWG